MYAEEKYRFFFVVVVNSRMSVLWWLQMVFEISEASCRHAPLRWLFPGI